MRTFRNSTLSFGLVTIPICVYGGIKSPDLHFSVCDKQGTSLKRVYVAEDESIVPDIETERSYDGHLIPKAKLDAIKEHSKFEDGEDLRQFNVQAFISLSRVPFNRVENLYYVGPKGDSLNIKRAYASVVQAMTEEGVAAVCKWIPTSRQKLLVLYPDNGVLMAVALAFASDVVDPQEIRSAVAGVETKGAEIAVARQLIEALYDHEAEALDTAQDTALAQMRELAERAIQDEPLPEAPAQSEGPMIVPDLMGALEASLAEIRAKKASKV